MKKKMLSEIFDPRKNRDPSAIAIKLKNTEQFAAMSNIGLLNAMNDAHAAKERAFVIKANLPVNPISAEFSDLKRR